MLYLFAVFLVHMTTMCLNRFTPLSDQDRIFLCYIYTEDIMQTRQHYGITNWSKTNFSKLT